MKILRKWPARVLLMVLLGTGSESAVADDEKCSYIYFFGISWLFGYGTECNVLVHNDTDSDIEVFVHYEDEDTRRRMTKGPQIIRIGVETNFWGVFPNEWSSFPVFIRARSPSTGEEWGGRYEIGGHRFARCYVSNKWMDMTLWEVDVRNDGIQCKSSRDASLKYNDEKSCKNRCGRAEDNCKLEHAHDYYRRQQCISNARNCRRRC